MMIDKTMVVGTCKVIDTFVVGTTLSFIIIWNHLVVVVNLLGDNSTLIKFDIFIH